VWREKKKTLSAPNSMRVRGTHRPIVSGALKPFERYLRRCAGFICWETTPHASPEWREGCPHAGACYAHPSTFFKIIFT
jgi:hypothetical protein